MSYLNHEKVSHSRNRAIAVIIIIALFVVTIFIGYPIARICNKNTYTVTITDKGYSGSVDDYIVWAEDLDGVQYEFINKDEFWCGKFNSGTVQGALKVGSTYEFNTVGWRIPFLSEYPNIIDYELVQ